MSFYDINGNEIIIPSAEAKRIRILEYNVGNFSDGGTGGYSGSDLAGYTAEWATFIGEQAADICLFSESRKHIDSSNTLTSDSFYSELFNDVQSYNPSEAWGVALLSDATQSDKLSKIFNNHTGGESKFAMSTVNINGVEICVVDIHFVHGGAANLQTRIAQMQEIISVTEDYENVIIGGDLNTVTISELDTLKNAGFTFANGGVFGTHATFSTDNVPLDNVGVKGDKLKITGFNVMTDVTLSDHYPTITQILVG